MIEYNSKSALLEIPKGLGNFAENGSGGGQDIGPLSGSVVELSATTVGIETNLGNLSGSTETLKQDLGELSGTTDSIGDAVADLLLDVDDLDTRVSGNTENIEALSGITSGISQNVEALSGVTSGLSGNIMELSGVTSGLAVDIETLSGVTTAIVNNESVIYFDLINDYGTGYTEGLRLYNDIDAAVNSGLMAVVVSAFNSSPAKRFGLIAAKTQGNNNYYAQGIGENYSGSTFYVSRTSLYVKPDGEVGNAIEMDGHYYFKSIGNISQYSLPTASSSTKGGVKVGSGLTINSDKLSVAIGEGLAYSGNTIVVSGGNEGGEWLWVGKDEYDNWTQAEKEAWYDNILDECWNNDNFKFGIYVVENKTSSAETGYDQMSVHYKIMTLNEIEAGFNSLHFSGAEFTASDDIGSASIWNARIQRGGDWEVWYNSIQGPSNGNSFSFTSGGTTIGYFDAYNFNRGVGSQVDPAGYYSPKHLPISIVDPDNNNAEIGFGSVVCSSPMPDGTYPGGSWIFRVNILFSVGADTYRMIGDSVGFEEEGTNVRGWHLVSITQW